MLPLFSFWLIIAYSAFTSLSLSLSSLSLITPTLPPSYPGHSNPPSTMRLKSPPCKGNFPTLPPPPMTLLAGPGKRQGSCKARWQYWESASGDCKRSWKTRAWKLIVSVGSGTKRAEGEGRKKSSNYHRDGDGETKGNWKSGHSMEGERKKREGGREREHLPFVNNSVFSYHWFFSWPPLLYFAPPHLLYPTLPSTLRHATRAGAAV